MPTTIKLVLDAKEYRNKLNTVIADTRSATAQISRQSAKIPVAAETKQAEKALEDLSDQIEKSVKSDKQVPVVIDSESLKNAGQNISKAGGAVSALSSALGGVNPQIGALGQAVSALTAGPVAGIMTAAGTAVALGVKAYQHFTESADEAAKKADLARQAAEKEAAEIKRVNDAATPLVETLKNLSAAETSGNSIRQETASILGALQKRYGDLGAEIDNQTGKCMNLLEVEERLNKIRARRAASAEMKSADASGAAARAAFMKATSGKSDASAGEIFDQLQKDLSEDQLIEYMRKKSRSSNDSGEIENYAAAASALEAQRESRKKAESLRNTGYESAEAADIALANKTAQKKQAQNDLANAERSAANTQSDWEYSQLTDAEAKRKNRQARIQDETWREADIRNNIRNLNDRKLDLQMDKSMPQRKKDEMSADYDRQIAEQEKSLLETGERRAALERQIMELDSQQTKAKKEIADAASFELEYNKAIVAGDRDKAAALQLEKELKDKNLKLSREEKQLILDQRKALETLGAQKRVQEAQEELRIQQLLLAGKYEEAALAKQELEAKKQGRTLTEEEKNLAKKQGTLTLQGDLKSQAEALQRKAMTAAGMGEQADREAAIRDAERKAGRSLSDDEKQAVGDLANYSKRLEAILAEPVQTSTNTVTNSLTARGGCAAGANTNSTAQIAQRQLDRITKINELMTNIKDTNEKLSQQIEDALS